MSEASREWWASAGAVGGFGLLVLGVFLEDDPYRPGWWWWIPTAGLLLMASALVLLWKTWSKPS